MASQQLVYGLRVDEQTRCAHYNQPFDVIAIKHYCCQKYYPCHLCHQALADHPVQVWPVARFHEFALLCGVCALELSVTDYLGTNTCPGCQAEFNPRVQATPGTLLFKGYTERVALQIVDGVAT